MKTVDLYKILSIALASQLTFALVNGASVVDSGQSVQYGPDPVALRVISDEDQTNLQFIKHHISDEFSEFKTINEVHAFLDKVKLLIQKHPKNVAFAQGELRDLHKFLSQEIVARIIRVDTEPFIMPISDEKLPLAQRAIDEDELSRKLFAGPLRSFVEAKRQNMARGEEGNHKDGNFFTNLWCKFKGDCNSNQ